MRKRIDRFLALSAGERRLLIQAAIDLPRAALALRLWGFKHCCAKVTRAHTGRNCEAATLEWAKQQAKRTAWLVSIAARYGIYGGNCLIRSLTLLRLLRQQGIEGDLRIGVRKQDGRFEAHAWVEFLGLPLNESADVRIQFVRFEGIPDLNRGVSFGE